MEDQVCSIIGRFSGSEISRKICCIIISCVIEYGPIREISEIFEAFKTLIGFETAIIVIHGSSYEEEFERGEEGGGEWLFCSGQESAR